MSSPLHPPLAKTRPCQQCAAGRAVAPKRLCDRCRKSNRHRGYMSHREQIRELSRRIVAMEAELRDLRRALGIAETEAAATP
jgi:hypothetical protein